MSLLSTRRQIARLQNPHRQFPCASISRSMMLLVQRPNGNSKIGVRSGQNASYRFCSGEGVAPKTGPVTFPTALLECCDIRHVMPKLQKRRPFNARDANVTWGGELNSRKDPMKVLRRWSLVRLALIPFHRSPNLARSRGCCIAHRQYFLRSLSGRLR